jgi:hypothetical protein
MHLVGFEPTVSAGERPLTYAFISPAYTWFPYRLVSADANQDT